MMAANLGPKNAVGAAKGFIGPFAYVGAAAQELVSSWLIRSEQVAGVTRYDFAAAT